MLSPGPGRELGLQPHSRSTTRKYLASSMLRREDGQILPGLLVVMLAVLAVGMMMFQVGKAALLRSGAQTGADAAALAGATEIKRQLLVQWSTYGTTDINLINRALVIAKMTEYAKKNKTTLVMSKVVIQGVDVKATVTSDPDLDKEGGQVGNADGEGEAKARARVELSSSGLGGGRTSARCRAAGARRGPPKFSKDDWEKLGKKINKGAPTCEDLVKLGKLLQSKGFNVSENTAFGGVRYKHAAGGYHYKCGGGGALDVNFGGAGDLDPRRGRGRRPDHRRPARARASARSGGRPTTSTTCTSTSPTRRTSAAAAAATTAASPARSRTCC